MTYCVRYSKGQLKIQEMAFVLVALMIFFAMISLVYFSLRISTLQSTAQDLEDEYAKEVVKKLTQTPEFSWNSGERCESCLDLDKAFLLKDRKSYQNFWELDYLMIEKVYPSGKGECTKTNYPNCGSITIINGTKGIPTDTYVSLCRIENGKYPKCEMGRIYARGKTIK